MGVKGIANKDLELAIRDKLASHLYPANALGLLGELALRIGLIQQSLEPQLTQPSLLIFAADCGFPTHEVSSMPGLTTADLLLDFLNDGAAINVFARDNDISVKVIDVGVDHSFEGTLGYWIHQGTQFFNRKISRGNRDMSEFPAMTTSQTNKAMAVGREMAKAEFDKGSNALGIGDVGIGNTSTAGALCAALTDRPPEDFVIRGSLGKTAYAAKLKLIRKALGTHPKTHDPHTILSLFGGYEVAAMVGAMLEAGERRILIMIDGFVSGTAALIASKLCPEILDYCVFCSVSQEPAHKNLLDHLEAPALLQLNLGIGEGSGIALAYPLVRNATAILSEMGGRD